MTPSSCIEGLQQLLIGLEIQTAVVIPKKHALDKLESQNKISSL